ncbi:MAG: DUF3857 domain-containing protein [Elusimicrobia bacterium]|nr:DUF3857 domain-containing protein [Elusimicrobiota bacterium]
MKKIIVFLLCAFSASWASADILYLNKGDEINGNILKLDAQAVVISVGGVEKTFLRKDVLKLQFVKEYSAGRAEPLKDGVVAQLLAAPPKPGDYPNDGYLTWLRDVTIDINADKSYTVTKRAVRYVLRERGKSPSSYLSYNYLPDIQKADIDYAYSVTESSVTYLSDISVMAGSPYLGYPSYDRVKLSKFAIPNVQIGSILDSQYRYTTVYRSTYPFFETIAFRFFEPVKLCRLTVTAPEGFALGYKEFNMPKDRVFSVEKRGGRAVYSWALREVPSYKEEPNMPPFMRYAPHVALSAGHGWDELRREFEPLVRERLNITSAISAKAAELAAGKISAAEKTEAIYNWVAAEIKYQPVAMEEYSYLPRNSGEIFAARAGNALDKPFLLYAMLAAAGLKPEFAYAQSKYSLFADNLANIRQFDYAECLLELDGRLLALAPLDDRHRYNELTGILQGAPAFRALGGAGKPALLTNPDPAAEDEVIVETANYILTPEGDLSGEITLRESGEEQAGMRGYKDYKKEDLDKAMESYVHGLHPQARLRDYKIDNLPDLSRNLLFRVSYGVKGYAMTAGRYMILKLPGLEYTARNVSQTERELPIFRYYRSLNSGTVTVRLPAGYRLYHVPTDLKVAAAGQSFSASYKAGKGELAFSQELRCGQTQIEPADYLKYKSFKESLAQFTESWIVLEK